jgi:S1-C subfamily serine protease
LPDVEGVLVRGVERSSAAERAGLERGDLIVTAGGEPVDGVNALHEALDRARANGELALTIVRGTDERKLTVSFDESPAAEEVAK